MTDERSNRVAPSMPRRAAVTGAWVGGMLCLVFFLVLYFRDYGYGISISRIGIEGLLPYLSYLPFVIIPLYVVVVGLFFVSVKSILGHITETENLEKSRATPVMLVISCLVAAPVVFVVMLEGGAAAIIAGALLGALAFLLCADWISTWRQSGFKHILFRTLGVAYAALVAIILSFGMLLSKRAILIVMFGGAILSLVFVSIGTLADRILARSKDQESAKEVGFDTPETGSTVPRGPATYDELKSLRGMYALVLIGIVVLSCLLIGPGQLVNRGNLLLPAIAIGILSALLCAVVTGIYARKVGIPRPVMPVIVALLPFMPWIALFSVVGYTPNHLKEFEPVEDSRFVTMGWPIGLLIGFCVGLLPIMVMFILTLLNPTYMAQLFLGPPIGANIPGIPIPCGWPFLAMSCLGVLLPPVSLQFGFHRRLVRGGWSLLLLAIVLLQCAIPSALLVMLGPATVQTFKQFFGG